MAGEKQEEVARLILTASGEEQRIANYAANALNQLFGGTNTTIE